MHCMKCGREIKESQVFCASCLALMQKYPVRSDVLVQLPVRPSKEGKPSVRRAPPSPEAQILHLRKLIKHLFVALLCSLLALTLAVILLFRLKLQEPPAATIDSPHSTADANDRP